MTCLQWYCEGRFLFSYKDFPYPAHKSTSACTHSVTSVDVECRHIGRHLSLVQEAQVGLVKASNGQNHDISTTARAPQAADEGLSVGDGVHVDAEAFLDPGPSPSSPPQPIPAPAQVSRGSGSKIFTSAGIVREMEPDRRPDANFREVDVAGVAMEAQGNDQVEGLVEWRDYLLGTGMYTEQNPIVTELNRWIGVGGGRGLAAGSIRIGKRREE